jgi:hypothetical protein
MKLIVLLEVDVSQTIAETMQRSGFTLSPDGLKMQVKVPNCPTIPQRKAHVAFVENPHNGLEYLINQYRLSDAAASASVSNGSTTT